MTTAAANEKIAWMRAQGIIQAQWSVDGDLTMAIIGPPVAPLEDDKAPAAPHNEPSFEDLLLASA